MRRFFLATALVFFTFEISAQEMLTLEQIKKAKTTKTKKKQANVQELQKELERVNKTLESYRFVSMMQGRDPIILEDPVVAEGDFIGGQTMLTIRATNQTSVALISNFQGSSLPKGSKIECEVFAKYKRACGFCSKLIVNGVGQDIEADLMNRDGSSCVIGKLSNHKEQYLTGIFAAEMAKGAIALSQTTAQIPGGEILQRSARNKLLEGLGNSSSAASDLMKEEYQTKEPIVTVERGTGVVLYFRKGVVL